MPDTVPDQPSDEQFVCPHCGSARVRRSAPHTFSERVLRASTPYHYYRCRDCGRRGRYLGTPPSGDRAVSGRPVERRDITALRKRRRRMVTWAIVSIALGVAAGMYVHGCQEEAARTAPPPAQ